MSRGSRRGRGQGWGLQSEDGTEGTQSPENTCCTQDCGLVRSLPPDKSRTEVGEDPSDTRRDRVQGEGSGPEGTRVVPDTNTAGPPDSSGGRPSFKLSRVP